MGASTYVQLRWGAAQSWARRTLAFRYPARYRELYLAAKGDGKGSGHNARARSRATHWLSKEHPAEYRRLLDARLAELRRAEDPGDEGEE